MIQDLRGRIALLKAFVSKQETLFHTIKDDCKKQHEDLVLWNKKVTDYKIERGKPGASVVAEIELVLDQYRISRGSYHGGDFNGVCCRRLAGNAKPITEEVRKI